MATPTARTLKVAGAFALVFTIANCGHSGAPGTSASASQANRSKGYPHLAAAPAAPASTTVVVPEPAAAPRQPPPTPAKTATVAPAPQGGGASPSAVGQAPRRIEEPTRVIEPPAQQPARNADRPMPLAMPLAMPPASEGPRFAVRGVDPSDVLYVRSGPGAKNPVVGKIPPDTRGLVGTGASQRIGPGEWREIIYGGVQGWVNARFLVEEPR